MAMMTLSAKSGECEGGARWPKHRARRRRRRPMTDLIGFLARFAPLIFLIVLMAGFRHRRAALPHALQSLQRPASGLDLRAARRRHDLRDPHRRHRPVGRLARRLLPGWSRPRSPRAASPTVSPSAQGQEALGYGWELAALAAIAVGLSAWLLQGFAITRLKVPPFVVTLGGMSVFRGAALLFAAGGPISGFDSRFRLVGTGAILRPGADPGDHLLGLRPSSPISCSATPATGGRSMRSAAIPRRRGCPGSMSAR